MPQQDGSNLPATTGKREIALLGDDQVFIKRTPDGVLRATSAIVPLDLRRKEIVSIEGNFMITAIGYDRLNKIAGLSVVYPPSTPYTFMLDGIPDTREVGNPFIEYDDETGAIRTISVTCLALGLSPIGNWCITHERLRFDLNRYFAMDAWSKVKRNTACGGFESQALYEKRDEKEYYIFVKVMPGWGLSLDSRHAEVQKILTTHFNRQKFAERIASTICRRNAMKRHPAIAKTNVMPRDGVAEVQVYGWRHDLDTAKINKMINSAAQGRLPDNIEVIAQESEIEYGSENGAAAETEISSDDIDRTGGTATGDQTTLFDTEADDPSDRESNLFYLGECDERLGPRFLGVVSEVVPRIETIDSFNELNNDELEAACKELQKHMGDYHGKDHQHSGDER